MIHYYSITCPRGYENEITVQAFTARAERDDHVARYDANPNGRSYPATRSEAEARLAINRQARALHRADGRYPEYDRANNLSEHGSHLEPILNTTKVR